MRNEDEIKKKIEELESEWRQSDEPIKSNTCTAMMTALWWVLSG